LRPFFDPPENREDVMDAEKWTMNKESEWFPGTYTARPQMLSPNCHPHLRLEQCMVDIPRMYPGDTVWWHADVSSPFHLRLKLLTGAIDDPRR
jgi:hypothetical protein